MKITFDTTPEQDAAIARSNASANPDAATRQTDEAFILSALQSKLDEHVKAWAERDEHSVKEKFASLSQADKAEVAQLIETKAAAK